MFSTNFPQLQFTPLTYLDKEAFRVARPYQLLCVFAELKPDDPIAIQFNQSARDIGRSLIKIDSGEISDPVEKSILLSNIRQVLNDLLAQRSQDSSTDPPDEIDKLLDLAYFTLITANDPYKLGISSGSGKNINSYFTPRGFAKN